MTVRRYEVLDPIAVRIVRQYVVTVEADSDEIEDESEWDDLVIEAIGDYDGKWKVVEEETLHGWCDDEAEWKRVK